MFEDRTEAGERLAETLRGRISPGGIALGIARGGVIVAAPVARELDLDLDVVVARKLGAPGNPELGIGAVAPGVRVVDEAMVERLGVSAGYLEQETREQSTEVARRTVAYRGDRASPDLRGRDAVVVDDGVATGGTALASIRWAWDQGARVVVFAAPVGPASALARLSPECTEVVIPLAPASFASVGDWYRVFAQVSDDEVRAALGAGSSEETRLS